MLCSSVRLKPMASPIRSLRPTLPRVYLAGLRSYTPITPPVMSPRRRALNPRLRFRCRSGGESSIGTVAIERVEEKQRVEPRKSGRASVRFRLGAQVKFGERVAVVGSSKELGSWIEPVPMEWTEAGWVCELDLQAGEDVEFKFVVQAEGGKGAAWEEGENRVLAVPGSSGAYDLVCGWNSTGEATDLLAGATEEERAGEGDADGSNIEDLWVAAVAGTSLFLRNRSDEVEIKGLSLSGGGGGDVAGDGGANAGSKII